MLSFPTLPRETLSCGEFVDQEASLLFENKNMINGTVNG